MGSNNIGYYWPIPANTDGLIADICQLGKNNNEARHRRDILEKNNEEGKGWSNASPTTSQSVLVSLRLSEINEQYFVEFNELYKIQVLTERG